MEVFNQLKLIFENLYNNFKTIVGPIAILAVAICSIKIIIAENDRSVQSAKNWLIGIIIGLIIFYLAPAIVSTFSALS